MASNRRARFDYEILESVEAGISLTGTEIKSIRAGKIDLRDSYARAQGGEMWLHNTYIAPYDPASVYNHDPRRPRKLLLHREQILRMASAAAEQGLTIVALRVYIKRHVAKVELGLARGKRPGRGRCQGLGRLVLIIDVYTPPFVNPALPQKEEGIIFSARPFPVETRFLADLRRSSE